ncbi:hypothetical protein DV738_g3719, partial [Chaetothyriales sp. CBS 135597]
MCRAARPDSKAELVGSVIDLKIPAGAGKTRLYNLGFGPLILPVENSPSLVFFYEYEHEHGALIHPNGIGRFRRREERRRIRKFTLGIPSRDSQASLEAHEH